MDDLGVPPFLEPPYGKMMGTEWENGGNIFWENDGKYLTIVRKNYG
jgi:hypothetical protein